MTIPFTKAHGAGNDFLLTWSDQSPSQGLSGIARAICERHTGVGADGWILLSPATGSARLPESMTSSGSIAAPGSVAEDSFLDEPEADAAIRIFNSDGSEPEISGNGARCAAAVLVAEGKVAESKARRRLGIRTGAGVKQLRLLERSENTFSFEMNMGQVTIISATSSETVLSAGNPQCAVLVDGFNFDWRAQGARLERDPRFPRRTNVSFVRVADPETLEVRFWERGAGETRSSGTGATGAFAAALARGLVRNRVRVLTPAGPLELRLSDSNSSIYLAGPAELIARGVFLLRE